MKYAPLKIPRKDFCQRSFPHCDDIRIRTRGSTKESKAYLCEDEALILKSLLQFSDSCLKIIRCHLIPSVKMTFALHIFISCETQLSCLTHEVCSIYTFVIFQRLLQIHDIFLLMLIKVALGQHMLVLVFQFPTFQPGRKQT